MLVLTLAAAGAVCIFYISQSEKDRQYPAERYQEKQEEQAAGDEGETTGEPDSGDSGDTGESHSFVQGNVSYEFLSVDIIEDTEIETQTKYPAEYFYDGVLPDADYQKKVFDYEKAVSQAPELEDIFTNSLDYTAEEYTEIYNRYADVIEGCECVRHPKTRYYFVRMRIRNESEDRAREISVGELYAVVTNTSRKARKTRESVVYFSEPQHTEGEDRTHSFFLYNLQQGETLACTVGFAVREDWIYPKDQYVYAGLVSAEMASEWVNPAVVCRTVVPLYDLPQTEDE